MGCTFEARPLAESMDVGGGQASPGVVGWGERKAVGGVEWQRGGERIGHGIFDKIGPVVISSGESCLRLLYGDTPCGDAKRGP